MTREEQIRNAATAYATHLVETDITDFHGKYEKKMDFVLPEYNAFLAGAEWADANPKSPQISVNEDLPCNHKELEDLKKQYIYEKSLLERYGYPSIITFEEWIKIKNIKL